MLLRSRRRSGLGAAQVADIVLDGRSLEGHIHRSVPGEVVLRTSLASGGSAAYHGSLAVVAGFRSSAIGYHLNKLIVDGRDLCAASRS